MNDTAQQLAIYEEIAHGTDNLLVTARAGTGKTTTLERSLERLPADRHCLFLAFMKTTADELKQRLKGRKNVDVATCHSFGYRVLRANGDFEVVKDRGLATARLLTPNKSEQYALAKAAGLAKGLLLTTALEVLDACGELGLDTGGDERRFAKNVLAHLELSREANGEADYDDQVWLPLQSAMEYPTYDDVMIDEVQDLTAAQIELALKAVKPGGRVIAVGDDRQSCFRFRGADSNAMAKVRERLKPRELPLTVSFRCSQAVIREAQKIVPDIVAAPGAPEGAVNHTTFPAMLEGADYGDFVLSRTNAPIMRIALALLKTNCTAVVLGRDIGSNLLTLVYRFRARSTVDLAIRARQWAEREAAKQLAKDPPRRDAAELARDKAACIGAFCEGARSVEDVIARVKQVTAGTEDELRRKFGERWWRYCVTLATTHKAKGLERERVWALHDTYLQPRNGVVEEEERNIFYVCLSRAKLDLFLVKGYHQNEKVPKDP